MQKISKDIFGNSIRLTDERFSHITEREELREQHSKIEETLLSPDIVKLSKYDPDVLLYYKLYGHTPVTKKFMTVIVKISQNDSFILSGFFTDKIKEGETRWQK
jgi:hypothetical protein